MRWQALMTKTAKWTGLTMIGAIVAAYAFTIWWTVWWTSGTQRTIAIGQGSVAVEWQQKPSMMGYVPPPGLGTRREVAGSGHTRFCWWPEDIENPFFGRRTIAIPLWIPLVVLAVPVIVVWRSDARAARHRNARRCAACGYDRHGLAADAKCPECGTVATK